MEPFSLHIACDGNQVLLDMPDFMGSVTTTQGTGLLVRGPASASYLSSELPHPCLDVWISSPEVHVVDLSYTVPCPTGVAIMDNSEGGGVVTPAPVDYSEVHR